MAGILRQIYSRYATADMLRHAYFGRYMTAYILRHIYIYIMANILRQTYYGIYITADISGQIRYGRNVAYQQKHNISTNVQCQSLSIAVFEPACCNASPQGLPGTDFFIQRQPKSKQCLWARPMGKGGSHNAPRPGFTLYIRYIYIYIHYIYIHIYVMHSSAALSR